jgi:hypothetical protein
MMRWVAAQLLLLGSACAPKPTTPPVEPAPEPVAATNPYGDLFEPTGTHAPSQLDADDPLLAVGMRALEEGRYQDARDIFTTLIESYGHDPLLLDLHRRAEAMASANPWQIGIRECDEFLADYARCIENFPEDVRAATMEALTHSVDAWREAAKGPAREAMPEACAQMREATQEATEAMGCAW